MKHALPCVCLYLFGLALPAAAEPTKFELADGDRILLVGGGFIERDAKWSYLEAALVSRFHGKRLAWRNRGFGGDTVDQKHRSRGFGSHIPEYEPSVVLVSYGMNASFDGPAGLDRFIAAYERELDKLGKDGARIVVLSPHAHEHLEPPLPNPTQHNEDLKLYTEAIEKLADRPDCTFVNLIERIGTGSRQNPHTLDGLQLNAYGAWVFAHLAMQELGLAPDGWQVEVDASGPATKTAKGTTVSDLKASGGEIRFMAHDARLPFPPAPPNVPDGATLAGTERVLRVKGLAPGTYQLTIDDKPVQSASAKAWAKGVRLTAGPEFDQVEQLRQTAIPKNQYYVYRWRPHNGEYVYGSRSSTSGGYNSAQGNGNSGNPQFPEEMAELDRLIEEGEAEMSQLAVPVAHRYVLRKAK